MEKVKNFTTEEFHKDCGVSLLNKLLKAVENDFKKAVTEQNIDKAQKLADQIKDIKVEEKNHQEHFRALRGQHLN